MKKLIIGLFLVLLVLPFVFAYDIDTQLYIDDEKVNIHQQSFEILKNSTIKIRFKVYNNNDTNMSTSITATFFEIDGGSDIQKGMSFIVEPNSDSGWKSIIFDLNDYDVDYGSYDLITSISYGSKIKEYTWVFNVVENITDEEQVLKELLKKMEELNKSFSMAKLDISKEFKSADEYHTLYSNCVIEKNKCELNLSTLAGISEEKKKCENEKQIITNERDTLKQNYDKCLNELEKTSKDLKTTQQQRFLFLIIGLLGGGGLVYYLIKKGKIKIVGNEAKLPSVEIPSREVPLTPHPKIDIPEIPKVDLLPKKRGRKSRKSGDLVK